MAIPRGKGAKATDLMHNRIEQENKRHKKRLAQIEAQYKKDIKGTFYERWG